MAQKIKQSGFTLIEVLIALTLFAVFASAFLVSQGYNLTDSVLMREDLTLQTLCEKTINQLILDPPQFTNAVEDLKETKQFDEKDYEDYEYLLEIKKMEVPDFNKLQPAKPEGEEEKYESGDQKKIEGLIYDKMKENFEKLVWQIRVTVKNKKTKYSYSLSTWVLNSKEKVQLNLNL